MAEFVAALVSTISSEKELVILQQLNTSLSRCQKGEEGSFAPFLDEEDDFPGKVHMYLYTYNFPEGINFFILNLARYESYSAKIY